MFKKVNIEKYLIISNILGLLIMIFIFLLLLFSTKDIKAIIGIIVLFAIPTIAFIVGIIKQLKKLLNKSSKDLNQVVNSKFLKVEKKYMGSQGDHDPGMDCYYVITSWENPLDGKKYIFESEALLENPISYISSKKITQIPVKINKDNPKKYYLELDEISKFVDELSSSNDNHYSLEKRQIKIMYKLKNVIIEDNLLKGFCNIRKKEVCFLIKKFKKIYVLEKNSDKTIVKIRIEMFGKNINIDNNHNLKEICDKIKAANPNIKEIKNIDYDDIDFSNTF